MSNPGLFKDLGKRGSDLLTKEFQLDKKVEWKGTTSSNVTVETNFVQKGDGSIIGTLTPSYKYKEYGLNFLAEVTTKKDIKLETSVENQGVKGLKLTLTGESKGDANFATVGAEFKHEKATFNGSIDYGKKNGSILKASAVVGASGFALGLSTDYFLGVTDPSELKLFNTTLAYSSNDFDATMFGRRIIGNEDKNEIGGTYYHNVNKELAIGTEAVFDTSNSEAKPKLSCGIQYKVHPDTIAKAKFDTQGNLALSFQQKFNENSKLIIGSIIDTNNLSGKNSSSFGFGLQFTN